jgi:hypothetical protein
MSLCSIRRICSNRARLALRRPEFRQRQGLRVDWLFVQRQTHDPADKGTPFLALQEIEIGGVFDLHDVEIRHPAKVFAEQVVIADPVHGPMRQTLVVGDLGPRRLGQSLQNFRADPVQVIAGRLTGDL